ncbi:MAG TPA: cell division protein FtsA [bacterium]|nr:cell division protein FtsA [bacterium]
MSKEKFIAGLDIGTSQVRLVVGQNNPQDNSFYIVGAAEVASEGVSKGSIVSIEEIVSAISKILEQSERMIGQRISSAFIGISGVHISTLTSRGVVAVSRPGGEIKEDDVERVINAAQAVATPPNYEILHVIPKLFSVDSQTNIKDPLGMTGVRLEVETQIIEGLSTQVKNLTKTIYRAGLTIDDLVLSILADSEAVLTKRQKELGVALVNIGSSTTSVAVFEEGDILTAAVLPVGSAHITNDIAIGLRTSLDVAESIKLEYGSANPDLFNKKEEIDLSEFDDKEQGKVALKHIAEIIEARLEEIFEMVDKKLVAINRSGLLPAGVVLTGGGSKLPGIVEVAKKEFRLPAALGHISNVSTAIDKVNDLSFSTALGLALWGFELEKQNEVSGSHTGFLVPQIKSIKDLVDKIKNIFHRLIP